MQFRQLDGQLASNHASETWAETIERECRLFKDTVSQWQAVQAERLQAGTLALHERWQKHAFRKRARELDKRLKAQARRLARLQQVWQADSRDAV